MIVLTPSLEPSSLLQCERLTRRAKVWLAECAAAQAIGNWKRVRAVVHKALVKWLEAGDWSSYALTLMHLGGDASEAGRLDLAEECYRRARDVFGLRVDPAERQNEAAAACGLGCVNLLLRRNEPAIECFEYAVEMLTEAREYWALWDTGLALYCDQAIRQIESLADQAAGIHFGNETQRQIPDGVTCSPLPGAAAGKTASPRHEQAYARYFRLVDLTGETDLAEARAGGPLWDEIFVRRDRGVELILPEPARIIGGAGDGAMIIGQFTQRADQLPRAQAILAMSGVLPSSGLSRSALARE